MKKFKLASLLTAIVVTVTALFGLVGCSGNDKIVIWTSGEDYKNTNYLEGLNKKFPEYNFQMEYMNSSTIASKILSEGDSCSADIILSEEYGYLYKCEEYLAELTEFDYSVFLDDIVPANHKFTPEVKNGGCVIINRAILEKNNVPVPTSYDDLIKTEYKGQVAMPNPASSGTGYMFLRQLTNEWGEDKAFEWFTDFSKNVLSYTSSGSGPVNQLKQGEIGVGLGMISQAATEIKDGVNIEITFFEEGAPFSMYGNAVMKNSASRPEVMEAFNYLATDLCKLNNELFFPDQIFKDFTPVVEGFPKNVKYGNMKDDTLAEKERLLAKWTFA